MATWKAPFLKGNSVALPLRVPSGNIHRRTCTWIHNTYASVLWNQYIFM
jgi:hypothetical protein